MFRFIRRLFAGGQDTGRKNQQRTAQQGPRPARPDTSGVVNPPDIDQLQEELRRALASKAEDTAHAFASLDPADLPPKTASIHIEIFDYADIEMRVFAVDAAGGEAVSERKRAAREIDFDPALDPDDAMDALELKLAQLAPFVSASIYEPYLVWEDDPTYGRSVAAEQPSDAVDIAELLRPWISQVTAPLRAKTALPVTWALHDTMAPEAI